MKEKIAARVERIDSFDLLRGFFLVVILFDHLAYYPSGLDVLTGRGILYASSAEGFFLISGIILGIVRGQKLINKPWWDGAKLLFKRSLQLYITSVVLALLFTFIGWLYLDNPGLKNGIASPDGSLWALIWSAASYQYLYGWADFLRLYAIFILIAPFAMWLLRRGKWYIVLLASTIVWALFPDVTWPQSFMLMPISWQLVFFYGLTIGFHWPQIQNTWRRITPQRRIVIRRDLVATFIITAIMSASLVFHEAVGGQLGASLAQWQSYLAEYFSKERLPIPRLVLGAVWFWALFLLTRRYETTIKNKLGWLLLPFGKNSLYIYTVEAFVVFFFHLFIMPPQVYFEQTSWLFNLVMSLVALAIVWVLVKKRVLFSIIPR